MLLPPPKKKSNALKIIAVITAITLVLGFVGGNAFAKDKAEKEYQPQIDTLNAEKCDLENWIEDHNCMTEPITPTINIDVIETEITEIGELVTAEYLYTNSGKFENNKKFFKFNVPFTKKYFIAKWDGSIKASIDLTKTITELDHENKTITVHYPKSNISSHTIDDDSVETLDEKDGLFNEVTVTDVRVFDEATKEDMERRAIENGFLEKADKHAEEIMENILYSIPGVKDNYEIKFKKL